MTVKGYQLAPANYPDSKTHRRLIAETANLAMQGKLNAVVQVTLAASATTTTVTDARIGANTFLGFCPLTADAVGALSSLYVSSQVNGTATLTHANTPSVDRTFNVLLIG